MGVSRGRSRTDGRLDFIQAGYVAQVRLMGILDHHGVPSGHGADDVAARAFAVGIHMPRQAAPADHRQLKDMRRLPDQARHHRAGRPLVEYAILVTRAIHAQTVVVEEPLLVCFVKLL